LLVTESPRGTELMADVTLKLTFGSITVEVTGPQEFAEKKFQDLIT